jgi:phenylalanyl-tRNA synthetase beta chain
MNISYRWLLSIAPTIEGTPREIADRLGLLGAPVDELSLRGERLGDILIGRVEAVRSHPNADRLRLCMVAAGGELLQVVCGAPNVVAGGTYPFAPVGAVLPGGMEIRKAKIRGETSEGMLCSASELGLGRDHSGIMALAGEWEPGSHLVDSLLELQDALLVLDVTPNRPDLLSHLGVARELAPGGEGDIRFAAFADRAPELEYLDAEREAAGERVRIGIEDPTDCPRYIGVVVEHIRVGPSPEWLAARLRSVGLRPINNVVDATNYVLHELGQPLHAFDLDRVEGPEIKVRRAVSGETLRTLDGVDRELAPSMLVIADGSRPVALAGVMGGQETEVTAATTRILIECAVFDPKRVRAGARALGLSTEASQRYERGVDPEGQRRAVERVIDLILATAGGSVVQPALDVHPRPHRRPIVALRGERVRQVLGIDARPEEISALLKPIGFGVRGDGPTLEVEVPPFRPDVTREIDVIEEIARRRGYDSFDSELRGFRPGVVPLDPLEEQRRAVHALFGRWGFLEARTAAFASAADGRVPLLNPLSAEESHLRDDLISGLLRLVEHNWAHGVRSVRLYETGSVFQAGERELPDESVRLAATFTGPRRPPHWKDAGDPYDVWDLKGLIGDLVDQFGGSLSEPAGETGFPQLDPAESFTILSPDGRVVGAGGRVLPSAIDAPAWADPVWAIEVPLQPAGRAGDTVFRDLPAFPSVERDIALLVPGPIVAAQVETVIARNVGPELESMRPFDVYEGENIGAGNRSIAWRLRYRHPERTLTDAEVDASIDRVVRALQEELGVQRR